jgi:molybdate transport system ATP-binding protein
MTQLSIRLDGRVGSFAVSAAFETAPGITALFGHSGAGKTTLLKMIAGMIRPETGRIATADRVLFDDRSGIDVAICDRQIGFVFQDGRLFPHLSVERNLTYARWAGRRATERPFGEVVSLLQIDHLLGRAPGTLSGGERQRIAIGRALLSDPQLLLMDEPLSSLDLARRQEILPYLEAIRDETRIPILYVSHEIDEVARLADTLVVLSKGRTVAAGPTAEVFSRLDLGPALGRHEAGALVEGAVVSNDAAFATSLVEVDGEQLELAASGLEPGRRVRLRIRARDVAIARSRPENLSIRNSVPVVIEQIEEEAGAFAEMSLRLRHQRLRARITRKSVAELELKPGDEVFALLKAISLERRAIFEDSADGRAKPLTKR